MLSASMSMPCSSMARSRPETWVIMFSSGRVAGVGSPSFIPTRAIASATAQCACTSMTFTRLPPIVVSRRPPCARAGRAAMRSQPTNARPASAPAVVPRNSLRVFMRGPSLTARRVSCRAMGRVLWPLAVIAAFLAGWALAGVSGKPAASRDAARETEQLKQQVTTLPARLHARDEVAAEGASAPVPASRRVAARVEGGVTAAAREERMLQDLRARGAGAPGSARGPPSGPAPTVETALERFYRYLDATRGGEGRERWQRARELVEELRGMGDVAGKALMQVLAAGNDSDERRAAARLLGSLQVPQSLPLLKDILERDDDLLLRRAAAAGLRQLQTPDSLPVMEHILTNGAEDRFIRLSAAYGLAEAGRP